MPRVSARLQQKRPRGEVVQHAAPKRTRANEPREGPSGGTNVDGAVNSINQPFTDDLISRLADAVTQRLQQGTSVSSSAPLSSHTPIMEIPAASSSVHSSSPVSSLPAVESAVHASILAAQPVVRQGEPTDPFVSASLSIDARVSEKTRNKIWNHEYIDFGSLLVHPIGQSRYQLTVSSADSGQLPSLCLEPVEKPRKISSLESWLSAFHVFVGVYTMKYASESPALMKYGSIIRDLAARGQNWRFYDENFRFMRQSHVSSLPWGTIHSELWLRSHTNFSTVKSSGATLASRPRVDRAIPYGFCFKFHRVLACSGCNFKHTCYKCSGDHVGPSCNFRAPASNPNKQPLSAKSKFANSSSSR